MTQPSRISQDLLNIKSSDQTSQTRFSPKKVFLR